MRKNVLSQFAFAASPQPPPFHDLFELLMSIKLYFTFKIGCHILAFFIAVQQWMGGALRFRGDSPACMQCFLPICYWVCVQCEGWLHLSDLSSRLELIDSQQSTLQRYLVWHAFLCMYGVNACTHWRERGFDQIHLSYQQTWEVHIVSFTLITALLQTRLWAMD